MKKNRTLRRFHEASWDEPIIFELSEPGRRGVALPEVEEEIVKETGGMVALMPASLKRKTAPALEEVALPQVLRHYLRLSQAERERAEQERLKREQENQASGEQA